MSPNVTEVMSNSLDPDQTAPSGGAVWSGSTLFAQDHFGKSLGFQIVSTTAPYPHQS